MEHIPAQGPEVGHSEDLRSQGETTRNIQRRRLRGGRAVELDELVRLARRRFPWARRRGVRTGNRRRQGQGGRAAITTINSVSRWWPITLGRS